MSDDRVLSSLQRQTPQTKRRLRNEAASATAEWQRGHLPPGSGSLQEILPKSGVSLTASHTPSL